MGGKGRHDRVLLLGLHLAVDEGHFQIRKHLVLQLFCVFRDGFPLVGQFVVLRYHRADDVGLPPLRRQLADEVVYPGMVAAGDGVGLHRLPPRGQLVDDRYIQIPVQNEGQSSGNGGGRHDQNMRVRSLGSQIRPLGHAETVLLVRDHQPQIPVGHTLGNKCVGTDGEVDLSRCQLFCNGALRFRRGGARQQGAPDA